MFKAQKVDNRRVDDATVTDPAESTPEQLIKVTFTQTELASVGFKCLFKRTTWMALTEDIYELNPRLSVIVFHQVTVTATTCLFYTFRDPSLYFFKYAFRLSDSFFSKGPCSCRQCIAELEGDLWFAERFNLSIHPLMTRENSILSEETFKWWQWLQSERQPANFTEVVEELFQVIPDEILYMDTNPERCRSCALVGNSGNLKGSHYGGLIDSSNFII
ncbi:hypothetical protein CHARACLAT_002601, partial [Characodon lateralis]|nr:hypothetical protein [Characodon lateralis]